MRKEKEEEEGGRRRREKGEKRGGEKRRAPFTPPVASSCRLGRSSAGVWEVVSCCVRWRMEDNCFV